MNNAVMNMGIILVILMYYDVSSLVFSSFIFAELGLQCYTFGHSLVLVALCCGLGLLIGWLLVADHRL